MCASVAPRQPRPPLSPEGYDRFRLDSRPRAIVYMLLSAACFAVMGAMVKAAGDLPVHQKVFFRNLVTLLITAAMAWRLRENPFGPTRHLSLLVLRSLAGLAGVFLYFFAIGHLPLADAALLVQISPFWVTLLAAAWLGERITRPIAISLALAFVGATLVIRPGFAWQPLPALAGFGAAFFAGLAYVVVRKLKGREEPRRIVFYFSLISTAAMLPPLIWRHVPPTGWQWAWLAGTGLFAAGGQIMLTLAYHHGPAGRISIWSYNNVLFSLILGLAVWGEAPALISLLGGTLIVVAAVMNHLAK